MNLDGVEQKFEKTMLKTNKIKVLAERFCNRNRGVLRNHVFYNDHKKVEQFFRQKKKYSCWRVFNDTIFFHLG